MTQVKVQGFPPEEIRIDQDLQLEPGYTIKGKVLDSENQAVAGAEVRLSGYMIFPKRFFSDGEGRFFIEGASEKIISLTVRKKGYAPVKVGPGPEVQVILDSGGFLTGMVVDSSGSPLEGAIVFVESEAGSSGDVETDENGRFRLEDLPQVLRQVHARKEGYASNWIDIEEPGREDVVLVLQLQEAGQILGIAMDGATGKPVHPVRVKITSASWPEWAHATNEEKNYRGGLLSGMGDTGLQSYLTDGSFRIRNFLQAGIYYQLTISSEEYLETQIDAVEAWPLTESRDPIRVELERANVLLGQVLDGSTGEPLPDVRVSHGVEMAGAEERRQYWPDSKWHWGIHSAYQSAMTGDEGKFRLEERPEEPGVLLLGKPGYARTTIFDVGPGPDIQIFSLVTAAALEGTVRFPEGEPFSKALVIVSVEGERFPHLKTDGEGRYRIKDLPPGKAEVEISRYGTLEIKKETMLAPGKTAVLDFTVNVAGTISGRVTDGEQPIPLAEILVRSVERRDNEWIRESFYDEDWMGTEEDGVFRIGGLPQGTYVLRARWPDSDDELGHGGKIVKVAGEPVSCDLSLSPRDFSISGRVVDHFTGEPLKDICVELHRRDEFLASGELKGSEGPWNFCAKEGPGGEDQRFRFKELTRGTYFLALLNNSPSAGWLGPIEIGPGVKELDITIPVGGPSILNLEVRDAGSKIPLEGGWIQLGPAGGYPVSIDAETDLNGMATIRNLPPGRYRLEVSAIKHSASIEVLELLPGALERKVFLQPKS